jgi:hypothetical protein
VVVTAPAGRGTDAAAVAAPDCSTAEQASQVGATPSPHSAAAASVSPAACSAEVQSLRQSVARLQVEVQAQLRTIEKLQADCDRLRAAAQAATKPAVDGCVGCRCVRPAEVTTASPWCVCRRGAGLLWVGTTTPTRYCPCACNWLAVCCCSVDTNTVTSAGCSRRCFGSLATVVSCRLVLYRVVSFRTVPCRVVSYLVWYRRRI